MTTTPGTTTRSGLAGIVQVTVPVSDLARSAAWYRDLLGLTYVREFGDGERVTGCALADWSARYLIALRLRAAIPGSPDLRGEHPIVLEAIDETAAERLRAHAEALGIPATGGTHADGTWLEFLDPDGIALRVVHSAGGPAGFLGVDRDGFYDTPRLALSGVAAGAR